MCQFSCQRASGGGACARRVSRARLVACVRVRLVARVRVPRVSRARLVARVRARPVARVRVRRVARVCARAAERVTRRAPCVACVGDDAVGASCRTPRAPMGCKHNTMLCL